jgi:hypothetical protein
MTLLKACTLKRIPLNLIDMRSTSLSRYGFVVWLPFNWEGERALLAALPLRPGVYALRRTVDYRLSVGTSDIVYIGSATSRGGLRKRLYQYFHPGSTERINGRILRRETSSTELQVSFSVAESEADAETLKASLLARYESEHGQLPPENRRH